VTGEVIGHPANCHCPYLRQGKLIKIDDIFHSGLAELLDFLQDCSQKSLTDRLAVLVRTRTRLGSG
jgi:hypothetical protein